MPIRVLPALLVNQIAAGEVVERPASVVKELVENAVDAGATRIEVAIEGGGVDRIEVTDDGGGIPEPELLLALAPHATSKIAAPEDLEAIATMGFRGEALASIASVSRIMLRSRTAEAEAAALIEGEGTEFAPTRPVAGPVGTRVTVRNLFFNVPARRKFLRSLSAESTRIAEMMRDLALAHPSIGMRLTVDGRVRLDAAPMTDLESRVRSVIDAENALTLLPVEGSEVGVHLRGFAAPPAEARSTSRRLFVVLNGRPIVDRTIQHAVREGYRGLIEPAAWPTAVLYLSVDPAMVDVNVHPAKSEVRFRDASIIHRLVRHGVARALREANLVPEFDLARTQARSEPSVRSEAGRRVTEETFGRPATTPGGYLRAGGGETDRASMAPSPGVGGSRGFDYARALEVMRQRDASGEPPEIEALPVARPATGALQVHSSYIVTQDAEGLLIIDQHALHERVMFERLRSRLTEGPLEAQRMLAPEPIEVSAEECEAFEGLRPLLSRLGIDAEMIAPNMVGVHAFPALLLDRGVVPGAFMHDLIRRATSEGMLNDPEQALSDVLDMMACKAAVKAGDRLTPPEIDELLRLRDEVERSTNCPHGRPTTLRISIEDLERQFGRR